jgi:hypothetical protein
MTSSTAPVPPLFRLAAWTAFEAAAGEGALASIADVARVRGRACAEILRSGEPWHVALAVRSALWETALRGADACSPPCAAQSRALVALALALPASGGDPGGESSDPARALRDRLWAMALSAARGAGTAPDGPALAVVAAHLPEPVRSGVAREAVAAALGALPDLPVHGRRELVALAASLPEEEARDCLGAALRGADPDVVLVVLSSLDPRLAWPAREVVAGAPGPIERAVSTATLPLLPAGERTAEADRMSREILASVAAPGATDVHAYTALARVVPFVSEGESSVLWASAGAFNPTYGPEVERALERRRRAPDGGVGAPVLSRARAGKEPARAAYLRSHAAVLAAADEAGFFEAVRALSPGFRLATLAAALPVLPPGARSRAAAEAVRLARTGTLLQTPVLFALAEAGGALSVEDARWVLVRCLDHLSGLFEPSVMLWTPEGHDLARLAPLLASFGAGAIGGVAEAVAEIGPLPDALSR